MKKAIIGIDPGASGGIAVYKNKFATAVAMPSGTQKINEYFRYLKENNEEVIVFIEHVNSYRGDQMEGGKSFGIDKLLAQYQELKTLLSVNGFPYVPVYPVSWQSTLQLNVKGDTKQERKLRYKEYAQKNFPEVKVNLKTSDALCLIRFGMEKLMHDSKYIRERLVGDESPNLFKI